MRLGLIILAAVLFFLAAILAWPRPNNGLSAYSYALAYFGLFSLTLSFVVPA